MINTCYEVIDSSKGDKFFVHEGIFCMNLCSYFKKKNDLKIMEIDRTHISSLPTLNLCNFASLCYKFKILYSSMESSQLLKDILNIIRTYNPEIKFTQSGVVNYMEKDCQPIEKLTNKTDKLYINKIFKDLCNIIGYTDSQVANLCNTYTNIIDLVPKDLIERVPMQSDLSIIQYNYLKELIVA